MIAAATAASTSNCAIALQCGSAVLSEKVRSVRHGWMAGAIAGLKEFGPYAAIELVLPGGSLIAILLWLHRRRASGPGVRGTLARPIAAHTMHPLTATPRTHR
jgi:hypothetical protein